MLPQVSRLKPMAFFTHAPSHKVGDFGEIVGIVLGRQRSRCVGRKVRRWIGGVYAYGQRVCGKRKPMFDHEKDEMYEKAS